jgi:hypothetical protein
MIPPDVSHTMIPQATIWDAGAGLSIAGMAGLPSAFIPRMAKFAPRVADDPLDIGRPA